MFDRTLVNNCIEYIIEHLNDSITAKAVAEHFHYSEAYFCREFKAETGMSVYEFIKDLKLNQSAVDMKLIKDRPITDVGLDYGYSASNYSTAFKKQHRVSPAQFRSGIDSSGSISPFYPESASAFPPFETYAENIQLRELADMTVLYERVIGSYKELREKWPLFIAKYGKYRTDKSLYMERFYNDPAIADPKGCIYDICMSGFAPCPFGESTVIEGGKYAVYRYDGRIEDIFCSVQGVFCVWLPASGYRMDKRYGLNIYSEMDESNDHVVMDLYIPVK